MPRVAVLSRWLGAAAAAAFGGLFVAQWAMWLMNDPADIWGGDFEIYRDAAARWLGGGSFYLERQLHGPYPIMHGDVLYPPTVLPLLVPFVWLPAVLWWVIPLGIIATIAVWHRPHPVAWALIAACIWFPATGVKLIYGNPGMWVAAAVALGTRWGWPGVLVLLKPTLAPFALLGIHRRGWWMALLMLTVVSILFLPMWPDAVHVLLDSRNRAGLLYSALEIPFVAVPVIAWVGGRWSPLPAIRRTLTSSLAPNPVRSLG